MSGRSGFRKTSVRRGRRASTHMSPDWTVTIHRRDFGLLLLPSGPTNTLGVRVFVDGLIEARGKNRGWVIEQMTAFLAGLGITTELPAPRRMKSEA